MHELEIVFKMRRIIARRQQVFEIFTAREFFQFERVVFDNEDVERAIHCANSTSERKRDRRARNDRTEEDVERADESKDAERERDRERDRDREREQERERSSKRKRRDRDQAVSK